VLKRFGPRESRPVQIFPSRSANSDITLSSARLSESAGLFLNWTNLACSRSSLRTPFVRDPNQRLSLRSSTIALMPASVLIGCSCFEKE